VGTSGRSDRAQDLRRAFVVPVVDDSREDVGVAARNLFEEVPCDENEPFAERRLVAIDLREVKDNST
jgi:hypothetical protein